MKKVQTIIFCLAIALVLGIFQQALTTDSKGEKDVMHFQERIIALAGATETKADYFASESARSVVFAPGAMFRKDSWHFLAEKFQELGISSVALNSGSTPDLLNAVAFLRAKGIEKITIVGASAGGAGVLVTLNGNIDPLVDSHPKEHNY